MRGIPKGALPPLCRRGGGVHRGGTPSKGSLPYAAFWLLFVRTKSNSGCGAEGPTYKRYGSKAPHIGQKRHHGTLSASIRSEPAPSRHMSSRLMLLGSPPDMVHRHPLRETGASTRMLAEGISWCTRYYTRSAPGLQGAISARAGLTPPAGRRSARSSGHTWCPRRRLPAGWPPPCRRRR